MKKDENIFDLTDLSDLPAKLQKLRTTDFGEEIMQVFERAKKEGRKVLNVSEVTVAFHRMFRDKYQNDPRSNILISNKLCAMASGKKFPIERVTGQKGCYRLKK